MAAVSVFEFVDLRACGFAEELISHADSAYRLADLESLADILHCLFRKFGAAGTVADEKTVVGYLSEVIIPRHECDSHAAACQTADDIVFCAAVHKHYPLLPFSEFLDLSGADLGDEVFFVGVVKLYVLTPLECDFSEHRAFVAEQFGKRAGVNAVDTRNFFILEPVGERACSLPVTRHPAVVLAYDCLAMYA